MFDVLKHLDIRIYRKVWNCIKQYWREEKWLRVTDDPSNVRFVGLNLPAGQVDQKTGQPLPQNNIAELDVDIILDDAPDAVTMQQEEFVALSEMVKSGIPVPPTAIIEASNLKNKDRILQEMRQGQVNPEAVKKMQEELQKLSAENQQLKADQQTEMAKIATKAKADQEAMASKHQMALAELEIKKQVQAAELQLAREKAAAEIQLEREKAEAELALERAKASAQVEIEQMKIAASADGEVDKAITEVKTLATVQDAKLKGAVAADEAKDQAKKEGDSKTQAKAMQGEMKQFAEQIVKQLAQKKKVTMTLSDGRTAEAEIG
jgi:hypothetical protein